MNKAWWAAGAAVLVACGGGGNGGPDGSVADGGNADAGSTVLLLSGARTGTLVGPATTCLFTPSVTLGEVTANVSSATDQTSFDFMFPGVPTPTTYVGDSDAGITCNISDTLPATGDGWLANRGGGIPDLGTCSVTLSAVSLIRDTGTQRTYAVHGSVAASLAPRSGNASGTLNFSASF